VIPLKDVNQDTLSAPRVSSALSLGPLTGSLSGLSLDVAAALRAFDASQLRVTSAPSSYDSITGVVPLVASQVALPDKLQHVHLLSTLPTGVSEVYSSPAALLLPQPEAAARLRAAGLREPRVLADRAEYIRLVARMLQLGILELTTSPRCVNGLFGVPKSDSETRLILDARPANCYFADPPHVELPSPSHFAQLQVDRRQPFAVAKLDLSNFYHQLVLPTWMRPYFALPALAASELRGLCSMPALPQPARDALLRGVPLFPCCVTLPMGFSHSVFLAQCVHEHVLYTHSGLSPRDNLLNLVSPVLDRPVHGLFIDDCVIVGPTVAGTQAQFSAVLAAYDKATLPAKASKCVSATTDAVTVLGVDLHGARGVISLSPERHAKLLAATAQLLSQPYVSGRQLATVLGAWTWQLLLRRPALSALKHSYRFVERFFNAHRSLWPCVGRELRVLMALSPLLLTDLRADWSPQLVAADSSSFAAGVVSTPYTASLLSALWPLASDHASLLPAAPQRPSPWPGQPVLAAAAAPPMQPVTRTRDQCSPTSERIGSMLAAAHWSTVISTPWRMPDHINRLELEAVLLSLRWLSSRTGLAGKRVPLLTDSSVAYHALRKGRSSAPSILALLRRCAAFTLAMGLSLYPIWVPSAVNPADSPSRQFDPSALASDMGSAASSLPPPWPPHA
jgi:hypothetical protein